MTVKELAEKCKEREINCDDCFYKSECKKMNDILEDISPCGLLDILNKNIWEK